jgi:hypothetical protein
MRRSATATQRVCLPGWAVATLLFTVALTCVPLCNAQQVKAAAVITDGATWGQFGVPNQFRLSDTGDVYFTSGNSTALFQWSKSARAIQRLLQTNDPMETLCIPAELLNQIPPGGLVDVTASLLQTNASGQVAYVTSVAFPGERDPTGAFVSGGGSCRLVDFGVETFSQLAINAGGQIAIQGNTEPVNVGAARIFIETPSGDTVKIAEQGTPAPDSVGGTISSLALIGFTNSGQVAFVAGINGGNTGLAVFVSDGSTTKLIVKNGDSASGAGTFSLSSDVSNYFLNNSGQVAFASNANGGSAGIWVGDGSGAPVNIARLNSSSNSALNGNLTGQIVLRGFNEAGQALFSAGISNGSSSHALFLKDSTSSPAQVVFARGQSGGSAGNFDTTQQASLNSSGQVAFLTTLSGGNSPMGWYLGSGTSAPAKIVAQWDSSPLGGAFGLQGRNAPALINSSGQVVFLADDPEAGAVGLFSWTADAGVTTVVSTNDFLPPGANHLLKPGPPFATDSEVMVRMLDAGGQIGIYAVPLNPDSGSRRKIVAEFDWVRDAGYVIGPAGFSANAKGEMVFFANLIGTDCYPCQGLLASLPGMPLQRAVLTGDSAPGGGHFTSFNAPQGNNHTQFAFLGSLDVPNASGIFLASPEPPYLQKIVGTGDAWPGGGTGTVASLSGSIAINENGEVAFRSISSAPAHQGLFVGSASATPRKVAEAGDSAPIGNFGSFQVPLAINNAGNVAFLANYGSNAGIFLGNAGNPPQAVATTGAAAPGEGNSQFAFFNPNSILLNNSGQLAFWGGLCCDGSPSGWFVASSAELAPRLLSGQALPDGATVDYASPGQRYAALTESGTMAIYVPYTMNPNSGPQIVASAADGTLHTLARTGDPAEGTDSVFAKIFPAMMATPSGQFVFNAILTGGSAKAGVFTGNP